MNFRSIRYWTRLAATLAVVMNVPGADPGSEVVVIYNRRMPESRQVAEYYASRRQVPTNQVWSFDLPTGETMTRAEYRDLLQDPFLKRLESEKLFQFENEVIPATRAEPGDVIRKVTTTRIRYAALCYGVPVKILRDTNLVERGEDKVRVELRRNEAAVDSELACLPLLGRKYSFFGPLPNPFYRTTNAPAMHPANGLLLVTRLDGPTAEIARGLVDKAMQAERDGLWGRAYFDARGLTNGEYLLGDEWIRGAAVFSRRMGWETVLDDKPETFSAGFPMSQIAFYAGWYDGQVSGPFTRPPVEFMPGAFAYHLHSFSAYVLRTTKEYWAGPLLALGATATMGSVDEPYLAGTLDVGMFMGRFLTGFSFGEAAYAALPTLSWQTTVVGDPLYRPFARKPQELHEDLTRRKSKLLEWSILRVVNLNLATAMAVPELIAYLAPMPEAASSALLQEKLGDLYAASGKLTDATEAYARVVKLDASPQQRVRVLLNLARLLALLGRDESAYGYYRQFTKEFPEHPDRLAVYQKMLPWAQQAKLTRDVKQLQGDIKRLTPPPATNAVPQNNAAPAKPVKP